MADTYVAKIIRAMVSAVRASGGPDGLIVTTSRKQPSPTNGNLRQIAIYPLLDEKGSQNDKHSRAFAGVLRLLTVEVMCRCAGTDIDNEALRAWGHRQIMADETLGGVAQSITEAETNWGGAIDSVSDYSEAPMHFTVEYARTKESLEAE